MLAICFLHMPALLFAQAGDDRSEPVVDSSFLESDSTYYDEATVSPLDLESIKQYRSDSIQRKAFDTVRWKEIVGNTDFTEKEKKRKADMPRMNWNPWNSFLLKVLAYILIVGLGVLVIYYLIRTTRLSARSVRKADRPSDPELPIDNIEDFNMQQLVDEALRAGAFALVIRYYYLGLLKKLNASGKIIWKKDKTNIDYLTELFTAGYYYQEVRLLTLAYETIWYGERDLSRVYYEALISNFQDLHRKVGEPESNEQ